MKLRTFSRRDSMPGRRLGVNQTSFWGTAVLFGGLAACSSSGDPGPGADGSQTQSGGTSPGDGGSGGNNPALGGGSSGGSSGSLGGSFGTGATVSTGGAVQGESGGSPGAGGAPMPRDCENESPALAVTLLETSTVSELGTLFATDADDLSGPTSWATRYGKAPEIIPVARGNALAVLLQDQDSSEAAHVVELVPSGDTYVLQAAYEVASLGRIMGLALDEEGNYFVATGVAEDEQVDETYPPNDIHRPDIVRIVKFDRSGCVLMESDVDTERGEAGDDAEIIVNPMVAGSSRLAYGAGQLALVHSHNTEPDPEINGTRHQKAITTHIDAMTGAATRTSTLWASHSFDQRAFFDGTGFVEVHLGDAYPRTVTVGRYGSTGRGVSGDLFHIKGAEGDNITFTRLGGMAQVSDPEFGYLALFSTERTPGFEGDGEVRGTRDLVLVRVRMDSAETDGFAIDQGQGTTEFTVSSSNKEVTNHVRWLTDLGADRHVERPRIVTVSESDVIALWEEWTVDGNRTNFEGTFALRLSSSGEVLAGPAALPGLHHISRGDDAVALGGQAVYVGGSPSGLELNFVAPDLSSTRLIVP